MSARNMAKRTAAGTLALAVCLGGGAIALASAASADANFKFDTRISGDDRYGTAVAASKAAFDKADNVILVNGYATVDGLTASYLAGVANAPILYVSDKGADDATKAEIKRLGAKNIWLVGGEKVIPASVADAIKGDGYTVNRINGSDRYETAALIAEAGIKISGTKPSTVFVASGTSFADALAVSPVAFVKGYPIILTDKDSTSDFSKKELGVIGTDSKVLVGGEAVVSKKVQADLSIKDEQRVAGADRAVTANLVSDWAKKSQGFNPANAALVGGTNGNGADSLVAAPLLGKSYTTLHFAGWDATAVYMKDHSAQLTGKGFVFGGKAAVPGDQVDKAQSAAQSVAAATGYIVTDISSLASSKFSYADPDAKKAVVASFASGDKFTVDGVSATMSALAGSMTVGDRISWTKNGGVTTWALVNKDRAKDYTTGVLGSVNTGATTFNIIEPVTGVALNATAINYVSDYTFYTVDGASATKAQFELDINDGDAIAITGGDGSSAAKARTIALTNRTVAGSVAINPGGAGQLTVKSAAGASIGNAVTTGSGGYFTLVAGDSITFNGATMTAANFTSGNGITAGDTVTYSRKGGVQTVTVADAAPAAITGTVASGATAASLSYWLDGNSSAEVGINVSSGYVLSVNGSLVNSTEFNNALAAGGQVVIQQAGGSVNASAALTTKPLSGKVSAVSGNNITVRTASDTGDLAAVDYTSAGSVFATATSAQWSINGSTVSQQQFASELSLVANGSKTATLTASLSGSVVTYAMATTANSASATVTSVAAPTASGAGHVLVSFSKPVYFQGSVAASDFTLEQWDASVSNNTGAWIPLTATGVSPSVVASAAQTLDFTVTGGQTPATNDKYRVTINNSGAAKIVDASGTAAKATTTPVIGALFADSTAPTISTVSGSPTNGTVAGTVTMTINFSEPVALQAGTTAAQAGALFTYYADGTNADAGSNLVIAANGLSAVLTVTTTNTSNSSTDKVTFTPAGGKNLVDLSTNPGANVMITQANIVAG